MRAAARFVRELEKAGKLGWTVAVKVYLYGSLALTGEGHGTPSAVVYGLLGEEAETIDLGRNFIWELQESDCLLLGGSHPIDFNMARDIVLEKEITLPQHANGMRFRALDAQGEALADEGFFSIGGGAVRREDEMEAAHSDGRRQRRYPPPLPCTPSRRPALLSSGMMRPTYLRESPWRSAMVFSGVNFSLPFSARSIIMRST